MIKLIIVIIGLASICRKLNAENDNFTETITEIDPPMRPSILMGEIVPKTSNEFPYYVSIHRMVDDKLVQFCGGAILTPKIIITAAQCIVK